MQSILLANRERIAWLAAVVAVVALVVSLRSDTADAGAGPIISTPVVYIATGANFPDALAAASPAALGLGPVLLVEQNSIPQATLDELERLVPRQVIIVGGTTAVSQAVEDAIDALAFNPVVTRIAGGNRYITAAEISQATFPTTGYYSRAAYAADDDLTNLAGGPSTSVLDALITAPTNGILIMSAGADTAYAADGEIVQCWLRVDTVEVTGSRRFYDLDTTVTEQNCATQGAVIVAPGTYSVDLRMSADGTVTVLAGALTVVWIPFGPFGGIPVP